jgi:hypothetical protein
LPFQVLFRGIFLIIQLVQSPIDIVFLSFPPFFGGALGVIDLVVVIVFLTIKGIFSSLPLGVKPIESGILRSVAILFCAVGRRLLRSPRSLTNWSRRLFSIGLLI